MAMARMSCGSRMVMGCGGRGARRFRVATVWIVASEGESGGRGEEWGRGLSVGGEGQSDTTRRRGWTNGGGVVGGDDGYLGQQRKAKASVWRRQGLRSGVLGQGRDDVVRQGRRRRCSSNNKVCVSKDERFLCRLRDSSLAASSLRSPPRAVDAGQGNWGYQYCGR